MNSIIVLLLEGVVFFAAATFAISWLVGVILCVMFVLRVYRGADSPDSFEWLAYLRSSKAAGELPPDVVALLEWMRRVWHIGFRSVLVAAVAGISAAIVAAVSHAR
jgi:hypothetical protein